MKCGGSIDLGQASAQLKTVWHRQRPSSHPTNLMRSRRAVSLLSAMKRAAFTNAAGPGYLWSVHVMGQDEKQAAQSIQSMATSIDCLCFGDWRNSFSGYGSWPSKYGFTISILWKKGWRSTTKSLIIGKCGNGPIVIRLPSVAIWVLQASRCRPFMKVAQLPHTALLHEYRKASVPSSFSSIWKSASRTVMPGFAGTSKSS